MTIRLRKRSLYLWAIVLGGLFGLVWAYLYNNNAPQDEKHVQVSVKNVAALSMALLPLLRRGQPDPDDQE